MINIDVYTLTILGLTVVVIIVAIFIGYLSFYKVEEGEIGFLLMGGRYRRKLEPGYHIYPPFISKVEKLDFTDYNWKEELRDMAIKVDLDDEEINELKEKIKERRDKKV